MIITKNQVVIGRDIHKDITDFIQEQGATQILIFTQEKVQKIAGNLLEKILEMDNVKLVLLADGEKSKNIESAMNSIAQLAQTSADQGTLLIAYGGGTVSDHVGFVASIFKRGIRYINIPTTLIGMIDASIGGKTALNIDDIKNQIGTFYQPLQIFIELNLLDVMSDIIIQDGLGEMFKYALLSKKDMLTPFKQYLDTKDSNLLHKMIHDCCNLKLEIVKIDEKDKNLRKILNLGHTFGHAIESDSKNEVSHGMAVINGILMASFLSLKKNYLQKEEFHQIKAVAEHLLPNKYKINDVNKYVDIMLQDKKNNKRPEISEKFKQGFIH